jgi:hypothetical protein
MTAIRALPLLAAAAIAGIGGLAGWSLLRPETSLRLAFEKALAQRQDQAGDITVGNTSKLDRRHLWLSRSEDQPLDMGGLMRVGTRIDIKDGQGHTRTLEVADVREIELEMASAADHTSRLLMVTCREVGVSSKGVVRFLMDSSGLEGPVHRLQAQRTL